MKTKNAFYIFLLLTLGISFLIFFPKESFYIEDGEIKDISIILSKIPKKDRNNLEYFFKHLVVMDQFGYVLIGEKPMAIGNFYKTPFYRHKEKFHISWNYFTLEKLRMKKGYKTWLKYQKYFPLTNFILKTEENPWAPGVTFILLINKELTKKTILENIRAFRSVMNKNINAETLVETLLKKPILKEALLLHDGLIGILLGYGKNNAWKFYKKTKNKNFQNVWKNNEINKEITKKIESKSFLSLFSGNYTQDLEIILLPGFIGDTSIPETKKIKKKYLKAREKLIDLYKNKDFLEETLKLLCTP